jgi:chemotaxis signal transduction protein
MHAGLQGSMHMHIGIIVSELANIAGDQAREIKPKKKLEEQQKYSAGFVKTKTQPLLLYI